MSVSRETLERLAERHGLRPGAAEQLERLLVALAAEPDPPTTVREPATAADRHLADSLSGLEAPRLRSAETIADLGAGAGFPGLALAAALPQAEVHLLESAARKCQVITRLARAAGLPNACAICVRAEDHGGGEGAGAYDAVTARALASLPVLAEYAAPLLRPGGVLVAWKGARSQDEEERGDAAAAALGLSPAEVVAVIPFPGARDRHLHVFEKVAPTPERYPRRAGIAVKRPLGG